MAQLFNTGKAEILKGNIDLVNDTIKAAFMDTGYTADFDTDEYYDDISASIASGSTDQTLTNKAVAVDTVNDRAEFDADDISISGQTFISDAIVLYKSTGTPSTSTLIAYIDITQITPTGGSVTIPFNSEGIFAF